MPRLARTIFVALCLIFPPLLATGAPRTSVDEPPLPDKAFSLPVVTGMVVVDGQLDEPMWAEALALELPYEIDPAENAPAPVRTECLLAHDERHVYIGFRAHDPEPDRIRAHLTDRDACFRDDFVGVMLDTFNDGRRGFEFFVNPLGVQMDLSRNEVGSGDNEDSSWDAFWQAAARVHAEGYETEMAIPFSSLRFPATGGEMTWGIVPFRAYPRTNRHQLATFPNDRNRSCFLCQAPKVTGFRGARPGRNLEIAPTFTARRTDERDKLGDKRFTAGDSDVDPGLSVQWGVTPNLALNATVNPDFSQVEADVAQLSVNRRFALFFREKRPFFLEGSDFFQTPLRAVHTRAVVDPDVGFKISGKQGRNVFGAFFARDGVTNVLIPGSQGSEFATIDGGVSDGVLRFRRDVGNGSTVGALATIRAGTDYENLLVGVDGLLRVTAVDTIRFQVLRTSTRYPDELAAENEQETGRFPGLGGQLHYSRDSRDWSWWGGYTDKDRGFRSDLGFITQADVRGPFAGLQRILQPVGKPWCTRLAFGAETDYTEDQAGELVSRITRATLNWNGPYQAFFQTGVGPTRERFEGSTHDFVAGWTYFNVRPTGDFTSSFETSFGGAVDFENAREARLLALIPGLTYDPGRHIRLQVDHSFERLTGVDGLHIYTANLSQLKAIYQFDTRMFARAIVQWNDVDRNLASYRDEVDERDRSLFTQLLFSYKLSPQTLFHIGYSDNALGDDQLRLRRKDRTFFLKLAYAWRP